MDVEDGKEDKDGFVKACALIRSNLHIDPTAGSGTTAVAARNTGRHYIVGDSSAEYVAVMRERLGKPYTLPMLELEANS